MTSHDGAPASRRLKIAFVIDTLHDRTGGTEVQLMHLFERMDTGRFDPHLFCLRSSDWLARSFDAVPLTVLNVRVSPRPSLLARIWNFSRILRRERFDIVQTHFRDGNFVGVTAAWLARSPVILSTRRGLPYWNSRLGLWLLHWLDRRCTWWVANSRATKDRYVREEGIDPQRCDVIYNGLIPDRFRNLDAAGRDALRRSLAVPDDARLVGIVANFRRVKGVHDFIEAARRVSASDRTAHFLIVGEGPDESMLRELVGRSGLEDRIRFLGIRRDVPDLLQVFDVGVLASHFESFSNSIMEYLAAGLPVVVTDVGGAREVVDDGRNGFVVPPARPEIMAEKIGFLLDQPSGPRAWRSSGDLDAVFRVESMVEAHQQLYVRLANRALGARAASSARHPI